MITRLIKRFPQAEKLARRLIAMYPLSARLGARFWQWYAFLQESEQWTVAQLQAHQFELLRDLLTRLASTSTFYRRRLEGVPIPELDSLAALARHVPTLSRREFSEHHAELLSTPEPGRPVVSSATSGTTGNALSFLHTVDHRPREWASICHQWARVGYDPAVSHRAEFRGLTPPGTLFQEYPEQQMVRFSILHLRAEHLARMGEVIADRRLRFYHGYPSALYLAAREINRRGLVFPQPTAVLLASEMVYDFQLAEIQAAFPAARLFAHYGCAEATALAAWCEHRRVYHVLPQYALVEVDPSNREIIGTNLFNDLNGFVRYRMTDSVAAVEPAACPACRRPYTPILLGIDGRREDYVFSKERGWIPPALLTYPLKHLDAIQELQLVQRDPESLAVRFIARPKATADQIAAELARIAAGLHELVGPSLLIHPERVDDIPRGPTGKFKWVVSELDPRHQKP